MLFVGPSSARVRCKQPCPANANDVPIMAHLLNRTGAVSCLPNTMSKGGHPRSEKGSALMWGPQRTAVQRRELENDAVAFT